MNNKVHHQLARELIIKRDLEWASAHKNLDLAVIEDILSDDYQQIQSDGSIINKQDLLTSYASGKRLWEIAESTQHHVQIVDDLAVVFGCWWGKGVNSGKAFDYSTRFISIYRLDDGVWKLVHDRSMDKG